jgi:hypothetical protein
MTKAFAWSWSVLNSFETCPWRHYLTRITKEVSEGENDEMRWGNQVHKALENRVKDGTALPERMAAYEPIAARIIQARAVGAEVQTEQKIGLTRDYEPCTYFAKDVYLRVITDVSAYKGANCAVLDYKTGKPSRASAQLALCAAATFQVLPYIQKITTGYLPGIWQDFAPRVLRLERAVESGNFPKNPSGLCRAHCPVTTCEHNGKYTGR